MVTSDPQLAATERTTAQQLPERFSPVLTALSSLVAQRPPTSAAPPGLGPSTAALLTEIFQTAQRAFQQGAEPAGSTQAKEAAEKAKAWSIVGAVFAVIVAVIIAVIAIVVSVVTFGAAGGASVALIISAAVSIAATVGAAGDSLCSLLLAAKLRGHPLAGRLAEAVSRQSRALRTFTSANRYDVTSLDAALREILQSVRIIEGLGRDSSQLAGPCIGDRDAVYQCGQQLAPLLQRLAEILQTMRLLSGDQTQAAVSALLAGAVVLKKPRVPR